MKQKFVQSSFLTGVLDQRASARVGTDAYANGLLYGDNVVAVHLGGVRRRPGTRFVERLSNQLELAVPTAATAPNGGTAANGYDDDESSVVLTTNNISTTDPYVVIRYDLGAALTVRHVDVRKIFLTVAGSSTEFVLQYSANDSFWVSVSAMLVNTDERSYRFTPLTGPSQITARYWRIARVGTTDLSTARCSVAEFNIWTETATLSEVRLIPFELNTDEQYLVALTDRSGFIYQNGALLPGGYFPTPYTSADLAEIDAVVGADSLFLVHEDYAPRFLTYDPTGLSFSDFQTDAVVFDNVPTYDFDDASSPAPTSEVQVITFSAGWKAGDSFQIELDGARSAAIAYAGDSSAAERTATADNIAREVQKLYTVPGLDGVTCARTNTLEYTVTFAGSSAKPYGLMTVLPLLTALTATATGAVTRSVVGVSRYEPVWSETRGYPRTTTFFEGRWFFGGTRSLRQSVFGSAVGDTTNFEILQALDGDAIFTTLIGQQSNAINGLYSGRNLQLFTSGGEFRYVKQTGAPITPGDAPTAQTQYGAAQIRPVAIDGATIFVQRTRKSVRDFKFDFNEDAYNSLGLSSLAPHLINDIVDIFAWNGSRTDEISLVFVINGDGTMAVLNLRREAEVNAWTRWFTGANVVVSLNDVVSGHDEFKAGAAATEDVYFAVARTIGGTEYLYLEALDEDMRTDASVLKQYNSFGVGADYTVTFATGSPLIGEECRATVDGLVVDNVTPSVGSVSVPMPTSYAVDDTDTEIRIGLNFDPRVTPMPLNTIGQAGQSLIKKQRVVKVKARVRNTLGLRVNGRVLADRQYDVDNFDALMTPFNGNLVIEESSSWDETEDKLVTFTQVDPLPMELLGIEVQLESAE